MLQTNLDCPFMNNACFVFRLVVLEVHPLSCFLNSSYIKHHRTIPYDMLVRCSISNFLLLYLPLNTEEHIITCSTCAEQEISSHEDIAFLSSIS